MAKIDKKKLVIIAVLGVLLLGVLLWDPGTPEPPPSQTAAAPAESKPGAAPAAAPEKKTATGAVEPQTVVWPEVDLTNPDSLNPFEREKPKPAPESETADPDAIASKAIASAEPLKTTVDSRKIRMICRTSKGMTALVGTQLVKVGDLLDGSRVTEIRPDGITLEPVLESGAAIAPEKATDDSEETTPIDSVEEN